MRGYLPILLAGFAVTAPVATRAQFVEECATTTPAITALTGPVRTLCTGNTQGLVSERDAGATLLVDEQRVFRGFIATRSDKALVFQGSTAYHGSVDDTIFWGTWLAGSITEFDGERSSRHEQRAATPYVAGVDPGLFFRRDVFSGNVRSPLPTSGTVDYRLLGRPVISSDGNVTLANADNDRRPIDPGPIENATVRVDFASGAGVANVTFVVRGIRTDLRIPLRRRSTTSPFAADCGDEIPPHHCPSAEVRFYGRQGEFIGLDFHVPYQGVATHQAMAAAGLANARGHAVIALRRE